jgi:hypothetical protein
MYKPIIKSVVILYMKNLELYLMTFFVFEFLFQDCSVYGNNLDFSFLRKTQKVKRKTFKQTFSTQRYQNLGQFILIYILVKSCIFRTQN